MKHPSALKEYRIKLRTPIQTLYATNVEEKNGRDDPQSRRKMNEKYCTQQNTQINGQTKLMR